MQAEDIISDFDFSSRIMFGNMYKLIQSDVKLDSTILGILANGFISFNGKVVGTTNVKKSELFAYMYYLIKSNQRFSNTFHIVMEMLPNKYPFELTKDQIATVINNYVSKSKDTLTIPVINKLLLRLEKEIDTYDHSLRESFQKVLPNIQVIGEGKPHNLTLKYSLDPLQQ